MYIMRKRTRQSQIVTESDRGMLNAINIIISFEFCTLFNFQFHLRILNELLSWSEPVRATGGRRLRGVEGTRTSSGNCSYFANAQRCGQKPKTRIPHKAPLSRPFEKADCAKSDPSKINRIR